MKKILFALMVLAPTMALAQVIATTTAAPVVATEPSTFLGEIQALVVSVLGLVVTAAIAWVSTWVRLKFKVDIEQKWRDSLHSAIMSGILQGLHAIGFSNQAVDISGAPAVPLTQNQKADVITTAITYAQRSVPDAINGLQASPNILASLAKGKLEGVLSGIITSALPGPAGAIVGGLVSGLGNTQGGPPV